MMDVKVSYLTLGPLTMFDGEKSEAAEGSVCSSSGYNYGD